MLYRMMMGRAKWCGTTSVKPGGNGEVPYHPAIAEAMADPDAAMKKYWAHVK